MLFTKRINVFRSHALPFFALIILLFTLPTHMARSEPWVDTSNIFLKAKIQLLADAGLITTPVTTYPLMWIDIASALNKMHYSKLTAEQREAFDYVSHQLKLAKNNLTTIKLDAALKSKRFTSFGDAFRSKNNISLSNSYVGESLAYKIQSNYFNDPITGDKTDFDGSYISGFVGNWVVTVGKQDRWWGQGWDSNLSLTNNARPIPAISLSRLSAQPLTLPFTDIQIPWTMTTFMGKMDDERVIKDTLLWGMRVNFKPLDNLEIGVIRLAQWGGQGRLQNGKTFWNLLLGKDNCGTEALQCDQSRIQEPGNQQAGYDLRYSFNFYETPIAIYGQYFAEDGDNNSSFGFLTEPKIQIGVDTHLKLWSKSTRAYIEYIDTYADCRDSDNSDIGNCFYEHHIYQTGMRYHQRTLGNLYDNDATSVVFGLITNIDTNTDMTFRLRSLKLNKDNNDKKPDSAIIGNPLTKVAENMLMLSTKVQHSYKNWRFTTGFDLSRSEFTNSNLSGQLTHKNQANAFFSVEYNL